MNIKEIRKEIMKKLNEVKLDIVTAETHNDKQLTQFYKGYKSGLVTAYNIVLQLNDVLDMSNEDINNLQNKLKQEVIYRTKN